MKNKIIVTIAIILLAYSSVSHAKSTSVVARVSTLGAGVEVESAFSDSFGGRIGVNYFPYQYSSTESDIDYDLDLNLLSASVLLDWHPYQGSFRITGGVLYNGNELDATAKSAATYSIGGMTYTGAEVGTLTGTIDFDNEVAPYLGIGWDTSFGKDNSVGFLFEIGTIYQGSPNVDLSADGLLAGDPTFLSELAQEEKDLEDDLEVFTVYPVIAIGLTYRF
jgi:hypothetical protein